MSIKRNRISHVVGLILGILLISLLITGVGASPSSLETGITATLEDERVYIGELVNISGTNSLGGNVYFYIKGANYPLSIYKDGLGVVVAGSGTVWDVIIDTSYLNKPDAGEYTIYVAKPTSSFENLCQYVTSTDDFDNTSRFDAYTTLSVSLIQPYISIDLISNCVVQGENLEITGTARGNPKIVKLYVFGTNFFATDDATVLDDRTYTYSHKIITTDKEEADAWNMATGQYFLVVQHPMYDCVFNIGPVAVYQANGSYNIILNEGGSYTIGGSVIFNTLSRQSSSAAQALIDAIGSQNIDDMEVHKSFIVTGPTSYVNAVPSQVTKGQVLTISGTTTGHKNENVKVELQSADVVNKTTVIDHTGVWSVSFDTSNMTIGKYTVSIAVGSLDPVTAKFDLVEGTTPAPVPTPTPTPGTWGIYDSNYFVYPSESLVSGSKVIASVTRVYRDGTAIPSQLNLDSDLVGVIWTIVINPDQSDSLTFWTNYPYQNITNFDMYRSSGSVTLCITANGTVSSESSGQSIIPITLTEIGGVARVCHAPSLYVYDTGNLDSNLQALNASIAALKPVISYYQGYAINCTEAQQYLDLAQINYDNAVEAKSTDKVTAIINYEDGMTYVSLANQSLIKEGLDMILNYTVKIDDGIVSLYAKGMNAEAKLIDTKNTGIKNNYDAYLRDYQAGNADLSKIVTLLTYAVDVYDEMTGYLKNIDRFASANLSIGWNFISVPKKLSANYDTAAELFAGVDTAGHAILSYNAQTKSWEQITGSTVISPLDAVWIYSAAPFALTYEFSTSPTTPPVKSVYEGWNAVGISADSGLPAQAAFGNLNWYTYLSWDSANQKFYTPIIKGSTGNFADTNYVYPWSGGWIYLNADGTYVGFTA